MNRTTKAIFGILIVVVVTLGAIWPADYLEDTTPTTDDFILTHDVTTNKMKKTKGSNLPKGLAPASATDAGIVTTGAQTFAGVKTLGSPSINGSITVRTVSGATNIGSIGPSDTWSGDGTSDIAIGSYQANLKLFTNNSTTLGALLDSSRRFGVNKTPTAQLDVGVVSAATIGQIITLAATPTANAFEINSSAGSGGDLAKISAGGQFLTKVSSGGYGFVGTTYGTTLQAGIGEVADDYTIRTNSHIILLDDNGNRASTILTDGYATNNTKLKFDQGTITGTNLIQEPFQVVTTVSQSDTAGYTGLVVNVVESATGSGAKKLLDLKIGGTSQASVSNTGVLTSTGIITATHTPASAAAAGVTGTITWDADFIYVCTATNTWKRTAIATW